MHTLVYFFSSFDFYMGQIGRKCTKPHIHTFPLSHWHRIKSSSPIFQFLVSLKRKHPKVYIKKYFLHVQYFFLDLYASEVEKQPKNAIFTQYDMFNIFPCQLQLVKPFLNSIFYWSHVFTNRSRWFRMCIGAKFLSIAL